jgi:DNA-directed RNA polymerase subunit RPC12/RpoP
MGSRIQLLPRYQKNQWEFVRDEGERSKTNSGYAIAIFRCLLCNQEFKRGIHYVEKGKTKSCKRCSRKQFLKADEDKSLLVRAHIIGRSNMTPDERLQLHVKYKQWYGTTSYRASVLLSTARRSAKKMNLPCTLTKQWIEERLKRGVCEVTGVQFDFNSSGKGIRKFSPSLDRQNPKEGYTEKNTRVVVWIYNLWKSNYSHDEVIEFAKVLIQTSAGKV